MKIVNTQYLQLLKLFFKIEWRQRYAFQGVVLQMITSVFLVYQNQSALELDVWNAIFWLMVLFNTINIIAKGFLQESDGKMLYYHSICSPEALITAKIIFNILISIALMLIFSGIYFLVLGNKLDNSLPFLLVAVLFCAALSTVFTMVSAIASGSYLLVPVLGLPLMIPVILICGRTAAKTVGIISDTYLYADIGILALINVMLIVLSITLYRFLWKTG